MIKDFFVKMNFLCVIIVGTYYKVKYNILILKEEYVYVYWLAWTAIWPLSSCDCYELTN